jgi:hypothetical protein
MIPVQVRSNVGYKLLATATAGGSDLSSLLVVGARPTGSLAAPDAAEALGVAAAFDGRGRAGGSFPNDFGRPDLSTPVELLSGPRVSAGGTLLSPHNALEVVLSATVEPHADKEGWTLVLLLSATPGQNLQ